MTIGVRGIGWVTPTGIGQGRHCDRFSTTYGELQKIDHRKIIPAHSFNRFGRMDRLSKLGMTGIALALKDAGLDEWKMKRPIDIVASTVYGCLGTDLVYYDTVIPEQGMLASPSLFAYTLSSSFLGEAAICFGLSGNCFIINENNLKGLMGLQIAVDSITSGDSEMVITGVCDLGCPEFIKDALRVLPCAVFVVIEKSSGENKGDLGDLDIIEDDIVVVNGEPVKDLFGLVEMCLEQI